jgi:hypothetical protein
MVVINIEVGKEKKRLYMDGELYNRINNQIKPKVERKDNDWVWIVDGMEGAGKISRIKV